MCVKCVYWIPAVLDNVKISFKNRLKKNPHLGTYDITTYTHTIWNDTHWESEKVKKS